MLFWCGFCYRQTNICLYEVKIYRRCNNQNIYYYSCIMKRVNEYTKIIQFMPYLSPLCKTLIQATSDMYVAPRVLHVLFA